MLTERPRPRAVREHPWAAWWAVSTVCFGAFMGQLDASIVTLAFPALQREFHAPLAAVQWVSLAYLLTLVGLLVVTGQVADALGRKLLYLNGFALFTLASAACGLTWDLSWLVVFRVAQAVGAAMLQANSVALVVTSVPRAQMRTALGVQAAAQALGLALGPTVGGVLVAALGWRWVFLVNVPVGCAAWVMGRYLLPRTRDRTPLHRLDWPGLLLLAVTSTALLLALSGVSGLALSTWASALLFAACLAAAMLFVRRERRAPHPLVELSTLRPPAVSWGLVGALCGYLVLFGPLTLFPQVFSASGIPAARIGFLLTALPAGFGVAAVTADRVLPARWGTRARSLAGAGIGLIGMAGLVIASGPGILAPLALLGAGLGIFIPANNGSIMAAIPSRLAATGGGLVNMARSLGTALGVAMMTLSLHAGGLLGSRLAITVLALAIIAAALASLSSSRTTAG